MFHVKHISIFVKRIGLAPAYLIVTSFSTSSE
jgi:hypothetical protein